MRSRVLLLAALLVLCPTGLLLGDRNSADKIDKDKIYHGDPEDFTKAGCIAADKIYILIPAYKEIVDKGLTQDDPEYWILMNKANETFKQALEETEDKHEYELIGELGAIVVKGKKAPNITRKVDKIVRQLVNRKSGVAPE